MISSNRKITKKQRNRKILSCFTCRSLRQKCDRKRPICTRCIAKGFTDCKYMSSEMDKRDYAEHLIKHGLSDARLEKNDIINDFHKSSPSLDKGHEEQYTSIEKEANSTTFIPKKVSFILPEPLTQKKLITGNQQSAARYTFSKPDDSEIIHMNQHIINENSNVEVDNCLTIQQTPNIKNNEFMASLEKLVFQTDGIRANNHIIKNSKSDFENEVFNSSNTVKNSLFLNYEARGSNSAESEFDITTQSTVSILQVFNRVFSPNIWNIWRFMTMDFLQSIDSQVYKRTEFTRLRKKSKFESKWTGEQNENLLETLLSCIPKDFDTLSSIVLCYFDTELHKTFDVISEKSIKQKLKQIFVTNENGTIVKIQLGCFENQYYLGIILTMFTMMVDPELYHYEVFEKINALIVDIKLDNTKYAYLKCQYFLIVFSKTQLHYKSFFLKDSGSVGDLVNWAFQVDFPNLIKKKELIHSASHSNVSRMKKVWSLILYIEILLFLEVGKPLRFKLNSFDESCIDVNAKGVFGLINRFVVLMRKLVTCVENPMNDVDFNFLISKTDDFIAEELIDFPKYFDIKSKESINYEGFLVLNPLMSFKVSLMCHKYSLVPKEEKKTYRTQLLGVLFASRRLQICQQNICLAKAREYEQQNDETGQYALTSKLDELLKNNEVLPENKHRPQWLYKYLIPAYGLSAEDELSYKAISITEAIALEMLSEELENGVFSNQTSMDLEELENLAVSFINKGFFQNPNVQVKDYTFYDILVLDKVWIEKADHFSKLLPARVSFPMYYSLTLVLKLLLTIDICIENKYEIKTFDEFLTKFETITIKRHDENGATTGISSAVVTDYNTTDYESVGRRSRASSNSIMPSLDRQSLNPVRIENGVNTPNICTFKEEDEDVLNSEIVLGSLPDTPGFNFTSGNEGFYFQTNPSTPKYTDIDLEEMGLDNFEFNTFMKLFN